jgi:putative peptidoglycan lipid II flippase
VADQYRLVSPAGRMGSASRWKANDESLSRPVMVFAFANDHDAMAVLEAAREASGAMDARFLRILDAGQDADGAYIISEWAEGYTLTELLTQGPLSSVEAAWVTREVATALASAHALHLFHMRVNPSDVHITANGSVKLSGLMVEAALTESASDKAMGRAEMEAADVAGCGRILYACLTAQWPGTTPVLGMETAKRTEAGLPTPAQVAPGTSAALNKLTYQILSSTAPGHPSSPNRIVEMLSAELGTTTGVADLARRVGTVPNLSVVSAGADGMSGVSQTSETLTGQAGQGASVVAPQAGGTQGGAKRPVFIPSGEPSVPTAPMPSGFDAPTGGLVPSAPGPAVESGRVTIHTVDEIESDEDRRRRVAFLSRRQIRQWSVGILILAALVVVAIITTIILLGYRGANKAPEPPADTKIPVVSAQVFDPLDGPGDEDENNDMASFAIDGNPATGWRTYDYPSPQENPNQWGMGVGLVLDLGTSKTITSVTVTLRGIPSTIGVYVPSGDPATVIEPPMDSLTSWTQVGQLTFTTPTASIPVSTTSRYVVVYILSPAEMTPGNWGQSVMEIVIR